MATSEQSCQPKREELTKSVSGLRVGSAGRIAERTNQSGEVAMDHHVPQSSEHILTNGTRLPTAMRQQRSWQYKRRGRLSQVTNVICVRQVLPTLAANAVVVAVKVVRVGRQDGEAAVWDVVAVQIRRWRGDADGGIPRSLSRRPYRLCPCSRRRIGSGETALSPP